MSSSRDYVPPHLRNGGQNQRSSQRSSRYSIKLSNEDEKEKKDNDKGKKFAPNELRIPQVRDKEPGERDKSEYKSRWNDSKITKNEDKSRWNDSKITKNEDKFKTSTDKSRWNENKNLLKARSPIREKIPPNIKSEEDFPSLRTSNNNQGEKNNPWSKKVFSEVLRETIENQQPWKKLLKKPKDNEIDPDENKLDESTDFDSNDYDDDSHNSQDNYDNYDGNYNDSYQ